MVSKPNWPCPVLEVQTVIRKRLLIWPFLFLVLIHFPGVKATLKITSGLALLDRLFKVLGFQDFFLPTTVISLCTAL